MPRFMAVHSLGKGIVDRAMVDASAAGTKHEKDIKTYRSFINMTEGRAMCLIEAPSLQWLEGYFKRIQLPFDFVLPVEIEIIGGKVHLPEQMALHTLPEPDSP